MPPPLRPTATWGAGGEAGPHVSGQGASGSSAQVWFRVPGVKPTAQQKCPDSCPVQQGCQTDVLRTRGAFCKGQLAAASCPLQKRCLAAVRYLSVPHVGPIWSRCGRISIFVFFQSCVPDLPLPLFPLFPYFSLSGLQAGWRLGGAAQRHSRRSQAGAGGGGSKRLRQKGWREKRGRSQLWRYMTVPQIPDWRIPCCK